MLTPSKSLAEAVREAAEELIIGLSRREILDQSLQRSHIVVVPNLQEAFDISNRYAPEHLIIHIVEAREWLERAYAELSDPEVAAHLGELLWAQGDQNGAQQIWQDALQENPDSVVLNETIKRITE